MTPSRPPFALERRYSVIEALPPGRLLHLADAAPAAIRDARLGDLVVSDGIVGRDVERPHDARDVEDADLEIDTDLLRAADEEVAVRHDLRYDRRHREMEFLGTVDGSLALGMARGAAVQRRARLARPVGGPETTEAEGGGEAA